MIAPLVLLAPAGLGAIAVAAGVLRGAARRWILVVVSGLGICAGVALAARSGAAEEWRTTSRSEIAVIAGAGAACAWLLVVATLPRARDVLTHASIGVASAGLALATVNEWVVPTLVFWLCSSLGIATVLRRTDRALPGLVVLFASDATLVVVLGLEALEGARWTLPAGLEGWPSYALLAAAALRAGVVPGTGPWGALDRRAAPALPLLVAGSLWMLGVALEGSDRWGPIVLLIAAGGAALWALAARAPAGSGVAAASVGLLLAAAVTAPSALLAAGLTAVLAVTFGALVAASPRAPSPEGALLLCALPPSAGFLAVVAAWSAALANTVRSDELVDRVPWVLVAGLFAGVLALTLAASVRLAAALVPGRPSNRDEGAPPLPVEAVSPGWTPVLAAARAVALVSASVVFWPGEWLDVEGSSWVDGPPNDPLFGAALVAAAVAAWLAVRRGRPEPEVETPELVPGVTPFPRSGVIARAVAMLAVVLALGVIGGVGWLTFEGLRLGFLG